MGNTSSWLEVSCEQLGFVKSQSNTNRKPFQLGDGMGSKDQKSAPRLVDANSGMLSLLADGSVNWPRTLRLAKHACGDGVTARW